MANDGSIGAVSGVSAPTKALFESFQPAVQTDQPLFSKQVDAAASKVVFGTAAGYGATDATATTAAGATTETAPQQVIDGANEAFDGIQQGLASGAVSPQEAQQDLVQMRSMLQQEVNSPGTTTEDNQNLNQLMQKVDRALEKIDQKIGQTGAAGIDPTTSVDPAGHARVTPMTPAEKAAVNNDVQSLEANIGNDAKVLKDPNATKPEKVLATADLTTMRKSLTAAMKDPKTPPDAKPILQGVIDDINATLTLTPTAATSTPGQADYSLQPA